MIDINNLTIGFGGRILMDSISFKILPGDRIGLIGRNGMGKTTLIKTIVDSESRQNKCISKMKGISLGCLRQELYYNEEDTIKSAIVGHFVDIKTLQEEIVELEKMISSIKSETELESNKQLFEVLQTKIEKLGEFESGSFEKKLENTLFGLGFERTDFDRKISEFSGGWKMRVELAKLILANHDLLLLDEPTNHLDIESIIWFENYLIKFKGAILLISHDKRFLNNVTNRTIEITNSKIIDYRLRYSDYLEKRALEKEMLTASAKDQAKTVKKTEELINKFRAKKNKAAFAQSLIKKLDKMERIEVDEENNQLLNIKFPLAQGGYKVLLEMDGMSKSYPMKSLFKRADLIITRGERIALIGKNGIGKSTFLKIITGKEDFEGGLKVPDGVKIGYFAQDQADTLDSSKTVLETIENEIRIGSDLKARSLLGAFLFSKDDVEKRVKVLSGGEKMRLALCKMIISPIHLLILDEPTNHLDIQAKEVLKRALLKFEGTIIVVSHDREFLSGLTSSVFEIFDKRIRVHNTEIDEFLLKYQLEIDDLQSRVSLKDGKDSSKKKEDIQSEFFDKKERAKETRALEKLIGKNEGQISKLEEEIENKKKIISTEGESKDFDWNEYSRELDLLNGQLDDLISEWENNCEKYEKIKKEQ